MIYQKSDMKYMKSRSDRQFLILSLFLKNGSKNELKDNLENPAAVPEMGVLKKSILKP